MTSDHDATSRDARTWCCMRLGDEPLVPAEARKQGPREVIAAALRRLADLKRPRSKVIYRRQS